MNSADATLSLVDVLATGVGMMRDQGSANVSQDEVKNMIIDPQKLKNCRKVIVSQMHHASICTIHHTTCIVPRICICDLERDIGDFEGTVAKHRVQDG